jgi:uncharacterized protein
MNKVDQNLIIKLQNSLRDRGIVKAYLFGSYARGEQTAESDLDLLVDYAPGVSLFDVGALSHDLEQEYGRRVDLVSQRSARPRFLERIQDDLLEVIA